MTTSCILEVPYRRVLPFRFCATKHTRFVILPERETTSNTTSVTDSIMEQLMGITYLILYPICMPYDFQYIVCSNAKEYISSYG